MVTCSWAPRMNWQERATPPPFISAVAIKHLSLDHNIVLAPFLSHSPSFPFFQCQPASQVYPVHVNHWTARDNLTPKQGPEEVQEDAEGTLFPVELQEKKKEKDRIRHQSNSYTI